MTIYFLLYISWQVFLHSEYIWYGIAIVELWLHYSESSQSINSDCSDANPTNLQRYSLSSRGYWYVIIQLSSCFVLRKSASYYHLLILYCICVYVCKYEISLILCNYVASYMHIHWIIMYINFLSTASQLAIIFEHTYEWQVTMHISL